MPFVCNQTKFQIFRSSTLYFMESSLDPARHFKICHYFVFKQCLLSVVGTYSKQKAELESCSCGKS